jgi:hypothetical protein
MQAIVSVEQGDRCDEETQRDHDQLTPQKESCDALIVAGQHIMYAGVVAPVDQFLASEVARADDSNLESCILVLANK